MWQLHVNVGPLRLATFELPVTPSFLPINSIGGEEVTVTPDHYAEMAILDDGGSTTFTVQEKT